jgi:hypothetical protein
MTIDEKFDLKEYVTNETKFIVDLHHAYIHDTNDNITTTEYIEKIYIPNGYAKAYAERHVPKYKTHARR